MIQAQYFQYLRIETQAVHAGSPQPRIGGAAVVPIFQSAVFEQAEGSPYHDLVYPRLNNLPNHQVLKGKLAVLEGAEDAVVTGSGMAAISTSIFTVVPSGCHMLIQNAIYGGTHNMLTDDFEDFGISHDFIDPNDPGSWAAKLRKNTRAIYVEAISNPLIRVADHRAVVDFAKEHGLVSMIDSTFATPVNFRPPAFGYDLSLHSATKYLNGHSDLVAGAVIGSASWVGKIRHRLNHLGGTLDPHACFLLDRGVKTLVLRVERHNANAQALAEFLESRPEVARVNYPGLQSHPEHGRARELFNGFGGMLSFELAGGADAAVRLMGRVEIPICGPSLGGPETLLTRPCATSHAGMSTEARKALGIGDDLIRMSVGIEAPQDLIADFERALAN